ncbi:nose resistant to fluoxetine protein 6-like [Euwallacea fornicatus]|uniref:nose resistant to fluoxetine protein 6-like n=1 Tax=Euwallacea fornicatus TaxID=995702 RepID=UPI0033903285
MRLSWTFLILVLFFIVRFGHCTTISDKQYASIPNLFYYDNYDNCMLLGDEALYCLVHYELEPLDKESPSEIWGLIKNISDIETNYRHDRLRHFICVPTSCPDVKLSHEDDTALREGLDACFEKKLKQYGVKGFISDVSCDTTKSKYPVDYLDIFAAILFFSYIAFIIYCTAREGFARYGSPEDYAKLEKSGMGKIVLAFSITRNWIRLNTIKLTPEVEKLRFIQGLRVYNTALVILSHTVVSYIALPVANPQFVETMTKKYALVFLSSGPLCVSTFFFISAFLLANGIFSYSTDKKMNLKTIGFILANRIFRLSPTVFVIVLFHATLLRHLGNGPNWNRVMGDEHLRCRNKGWSNVLFINNLDPYDMCLPTTWYLALDTQYFIISLFLIWMIKCYEKHAYYIFGGFISINIVASFVQNYYYDFSALDIPVAEKYFELRHVLEGNQFHYQLCSFIGNFTPTLVGLMFGYFFYKHKNEKIMIFNNKCRQIVWWFIAWGIGLSIVVIPGYFLLHYNSKPSRFWASVFVALSRPLFTFALGVGYFGVIDGIGWLSKTALEWKPTYILGRLTFSAYLVHMSLIMLRPAVARYPLYISDFTIVTSFLGDMALVFLIAAILTLLLELPLSELQKLVFGINKKEEKSEDNPKDK